MFIVFEGIDGSGKTTISNRVAARLRGMGRPICHAREGGALASPIAERIRALTRDVHHLALGAEAELLLYAAREAQTVEEVVRPALERGEWVITDRFVYSHLALAREGRGLEHPALWQVLEFAASRTLPDLVVFIDVEPAIARARKRCGKIISGKRADPSRKGQAGAGLASRVRRGFHQLAQADPERWLVYDNTWASLDEAEETILEAILARAEGRPLPPVRRSGIPAGLPPSAPALEDEGAVREALLAAVDTLSAREPPLAAHLLRGLTGAEVDERRARLARLAPAVVAHGLTRLEGPGPMALRHFLKAGVPGPVAHSLTGLWGEEAIELRQALVLSAPAEVARSLAGVADAEAARLRAQLAERVPDDVLWGLARVEGEEAWALRRALRESVPADALARSLGGLDSMEAWALRAQLLPIAPLAVIEGLEGVHGPQAHALREQYMRRAPRAVLETLLGLDDEAAWRLREAVRDSMREAVESAIGLMSERAWALRERLGAIWPAAVIHSLRGAAGAARGREMLFRLLRRASGDLEVLREAAWVLDVISQPAGETPLSRAG